MEIKTKKVSMGVEIKVIEDEQIIKTYLFSEGSKDLIPQLQNCIDILQDYVNQQEYLESIKINQL